jgi:hypothetical protein
VACRSYVGLGRKKLVNTKKKEEGEKINMMYDEIKKFLCKPKVVMVCIM